MIIRTTQRPPVSKVNSSAPLNGRLWVCSWLFPHSGSCSWGYFSLITENHSALTKIVAVADIYDALTSKRPYKAPWSHEDAVDEIMRGRGTQFDPMIVDAFVANEAAFRRIRHEFVDKGTMNL